MKNKIKLIVGLGNPGIKYIMTRHNTGSRYIHFLSEKYNINLIKNIFFLGYIGKIKTIKNKNIYLLIPITYINLSGKSVIKTKQYFKIKSKEILIAHDDLNLKLGKNKIKFGGSHYGHNGLKNIQKEINSSNFYRIRFGIGRPENKNKITNFVLNKPKKKEQNIIDQGIQKIVNYSNLIFEENINMLIKKINEK